MAERLESHRAFSVGRCSGSAVTTDFAGHPLPRYASRMDDAVARCRSAVRDHPEDGPGERRALRPARGDHRWRAMPVLRRRGGGNAGGNPQPDREQHPARRPGSPLGAQFGDVDHRGAGHLGCSSVARATRIRGSRGEEASSILAKTDARLLFAADGFLGTDYTGALRAVAPGLRALERPVRLPLPGESTSPSWEQFLSRGADVPATHAEGSIDAGASGDVSDVIFTSGTTGMPKGVMLRHGASLHGYQIFRDRFGLAEGRQVHHSDAVLPLLRLQGRVDDQSHVRGCRVPARRLRRRYGCSS